MDQKPCKCIYCGNVASLTLPCDCPACERTLRGFVDEMTAAELFLSARLNGLETTLEWVKV